MEDGIVLTALGHWMSQPATSAVLPPSIMPVVIVSGSDYQMGYQYGQQAGQYIEVQKDAAWFKGLKTLGSREKVIHELAALQYHIKKYAPETIKGMKGIADGATAAGYKVSYTDILLINNQIRKPTSTVTYPAEAQDEEVTLEGCSNWSAWGSTTVDGRLICSKSSDEEFGHQVAVVAFPDEGNSYIGTASPGNLVGAPCMNNRGVFIGTSGGYARRDVDFDYGIYKTCGFQHLLRFANSASEARDMAMAWQEPRPSSLHVSDVRGNAFVAEVTAAIKSVRKPGDFGESGFIYSTNNYFMDDMKEAIKGEKFIEHAGWLGRGWSISSITRNLQLWDFLHNYRGNVDLEFAKMMWRFPGNPPPYPLNEASYEASQGQCWDAKICNLDNRRIGIMLPDDGEGGLAYICTGPAGRVTHPLKPTGGDWYQIAAPHTFYQLALASSPAAVVEAARKEAHACIAAAYREFMVLKYTDPGYAILDQLYSLANSEYYAGINNRNKGALETRDEQHRYFANAATAFTRSQAHAKQLFNAMVPPATSPEALGLKPWGYWTRQQ